MAPLEAAVARRRWRVSSPRRQDRRPDFRRGPELGAWGRRHACRGLAAAISAEALLAICGTASGVARSLTAFGPIAVAVVVLGAIVLVAAAGDQLKFSRIQSAHVTFPYVGTDVEVVRQVDCRGRVTAASQQNAQSLCGTTRGAPVTRPKERRFWLQSTCGSRCRYGIG